MATCENCDRADCPTLLPRIDCRAMPAAERWPIGGLVDADGDPECAGCLEGERRLRDCAAHRVDWRPRALAAEAVIARVREACARNDVVRMFGGAAGAVAMAKNKLRAEILALLGD